MVFAFQCITFYLLYRRVVCRRSNRMVLLPQYYILLALYLTIQNLYPFQIPFTLTLRVWDVYLLVGERILTGMAYNLLKMHRRTLSRLGMDEILQFLQVS